MNAAQHRKWYYSNLEEVRARYRGYYYRGRAYINTLKDRPCSDCGVKYDPVCMQFDHIGTDKKMNIARMTTYSKARIDAEVAKCELVCANCHALRTHSRIGSWPNGKAAVLETVESTFES